VNQHSPMLISAQSRSASYVPEVVTMRPWINWLQYIGIQPCMLECKGKEFEGCLTLSDLLASSPCSPLTSSQSMRFAWWMSNNTIAKKLRKHPLASYCLQ
jgi:hypothetical protein